MNIEFHNYVIKVKKNSDLHESIVQHLIYKKEIEGYVINCFTNDDGKQKVYLERNKSSIRFNLDKNYVIIKNSITFFNLKKHSSIKFTFKIS